MSHSLPGASISVTYQITQALRARRHEEELEDARTQLPTVQKDVESYQSQVEAHKKRADEAEEALGEAKAEWEKQKASWIEEKQTRERSDSNGPRAWLEDVPGQSFRASSSRPQSPLIQGPPRTWSSDLLGLQALPNKGRKASAPTSTDDLAERFSMARRPSTQLPIRPLQAGTSGQPTPPPIFSPTVEALPTPSSTHPLDQYDALESAETSSSPQQMLQDMVSVSTVAAGPSVQAMEWMSAAVRRLKSESVAAREGLARISNQRDEARGEIVSLMREVEAGKAAVKRVADLEAQVAGGMARYETTLELHGEKSELVEELRADVEDVKAMYRDLVERTVR